MNSSIFLDSGAYSAWTSGQELNVQDYITYIKEHEHLIDIYANLDVIGSAEGTWANQRAMEKAGLKPLPVFHVNEDPKYLAMCMEYDYFAVGGMAKTSSSVLQYQIDEVFSIICPKSNDYFPTHKIHGFGCTKPNLVVGYPWYSVDSSSWVKYGLFGIVLIPRFFHGKALYNKPPMAITMSNRSKGVGEVHHFANLPRMEQEAILNYFVEKGIVVGKSEIVDVESGCIPQENECWVNKEKTKLEVVSVPGLVNSHIERDHANLQYFLDLEKYQQAWPWAWKKKSGRLDI